MSTPTYAPFSAATKRAALEHAGHRCQDPLCGRGPEWRHLREDLAIISLPAHMAATFLAPMPPLMTVGPIRMEGQYGPAKLQDLIAVRDAIMTSRSRFPRVLNRIIKRFKLDGNALLEVDHEREDADGGGNGLDNATVRCVFCHAFKTQARGNSRRRAPSKAAPSAAPRAVQLDIIHRAKVEQVRALMGTAKHAPLAQAGERRHFKDAEFEAAARRREEAGNDGFFGA